MTRDEALTFLSKVEILQGLTRKDIELFLDFSTESSFTVGDTLIGEGQMRPPFRILCSGGVKVVLPEHSEDPSVRRIAEHRLNTLGPGECFGEYSMLEDMPASASVVATEPGQALELPHTHFKNFLASDDRIGRIVYHNMLRILVGRLKRREGSHDLHLIVR